MNATLKLWKGWVIIAAGLLGVGVVALRPQPVEVEVETVRRGLFEQTVDEDGKTRVRERYTVSAPLEGILERVHLRAGDPVEYGMLLAVIQPRVPILVDARTELELQKRVGAAEAEQQRTVAALERAQAAFQQAKTDYERTKALAEEDVIAPARREHEALTLELAAKDLLAARFAADVARHQVEMARAALPRIHKSAKVAAGLDQRWEIRSPVLGRLLRVFQESEGVVALGAPLLEIADVTALEVVVDVLTTDAVQIEPGAVVHFERWGGDAAVAGRVRVVEPGAFTKVSALGVEEQRTDVVVDVVAPPEQWKVVGDGYRVDARIVVFRKDRAIAIPVGALFRERESWMVFVDADGRAQKRAIQVTRRNGVEALVDEGLNPGESVILYPSDAVQDGVRTIRRQERVAAEGR